MEDDGLEPPNSGLQPDALPDELTFQKKSAMRNARIHAALQAAPAT